MHIVQSRPGSFFIPILLAIFILLPKTGIAANPWDKHKEGILFELSEDQFGEPMDTKAFRPKPKPQTQAEEKVETPTIEAAAKKENPETKPSTSAGAKETPKDKINKDKINIVEKKELKKVSTDSPEKVLMQNIPSPPLLKPLLNLAFKISTIILSSIALIFSIKALKIAKNTEETVSEFIGKL